MIKRVSTYVLLTCFAAAAVPDRADGQTRKRPARDERKFTVPTQRTIRPGKTYVKFEIVAERGAGLRAQQWQQAFAKMGVSVRIYSARVQVKEPVSERVVGTLRYVTVNGELDQRGRLFCGEKVFARSDTAKLNEWVRELKTYGAQGSPEGKPVWGLSQSQFQTVYDHLAVMVEKPSSGTTLSVRLTGLPIPVQHPVRMSVAARRWLDSPASQPAAGESALSARDTRGFSVGTVLALTLSQYGLGFRPLRAPDGRIELVVDPLPKVDRAWPVGWDLPKDRSKLQTAPQLFKLFPVELQDVKLLDVLHAVEAQSRVSVWLDTFRIRNELQLKLDELLVSFPKKQVSWSQVLRAVTTPRHMRQKLVIDERGRPLIWITSLERRNVRP
ncbi:MAG: hypothetical protein ABGZ17_04285 [Planctomycetaceae bacterium]